MKNTKKTLLIEIISLVVLVAVIGAIVGIVSNSMKKAENMLDDVYGDIQGNESSSDSAGAEDSDSTDTDTSTDTETDTTVSDDGKLTLADGEILYGLRPNSSSGKNLMILYVDGLKANTEYKVSWSFKSTYESYGFNFDYTDNDGDGQVSPEFKFSVTADRSKGYEETSIPDDGTSVSKLLSTSTTFTTNSEGYFEMGAFIADYTIDQDECAAQREAFLKVINYVEIEEV